MHYNDFKKRVKSFFFTLSIVLAILVSYYLIVRFTSFRIPCVFHLITKLNCPGCGITRMLTRFLQFKISEGIKYNYFLGYTLPIVILMISMMSYYYLYNKKYDKWFKILSLIYLCLLLAWGVIRNIIGI